MYLRGTNFPELSGFSEHEKREILRRAWHERRGYTYLAPVLAAFMPGLGYLVERYHHLSSASITVISGIFGVVLAFVFLVTLLNTVVRSEARVIAAKIRDNTLETDASDAGSS